MQSKTVARRRKTHRSPEFFVVHNNGRRSKVNAYDFKRNLDVGNLIQTIEQQRDEPNAAFVCPGIVAYFTRRDFQSGSTSRSDEHVGGAQVTFEIASRISVEQIEVELLNHFQSAISSRLIESGKLRSLSQAEIRTAVERHAHRLAVDIVRERQLIRMRRHVSDWLRWLRGIIEGGFLSTRELQSRCAAGLPRFSGEPLIPGDPQTAFAIW